MSRRHSPNDKVKIKGSTSPSNADNEQRYCICQKREDELTEQESNDFMIECDGCNGWFHGKCIGLADRIADDIEKYFCAECTNQYGPSIFKQRRNQHRRDYSDGNAENKPIQSGTQEFIQKLKRRVFPSCEPVVTRLTGRQLTADYLIKNGFTKPILVSHREGLELTLPNRTISLTEINELVGPDRFIDIIDCEKQVTYKMSLDDYIEYFESFDRQKIYNVLSLEISNTKLGEHVIIPRIVRDLSWATIGVWPTKNKNEEENETTTKKKRVTSSSDAEPSDDEANEEINENHFENFERPEVAKYCLVSPQSSYTDFHVDFGGSSVWYSVVRGEKIFYLIEPTDENLQKYAEWSKSPTESETFLADCVSHCYKMHLREDNTVFIPAGWIHAVYTITDSLVFGGNFLQSMGVDMQLRIYDLERLAQVPQKFQFPLFETFHWYAAKYFYEELKTLNESNSLTLNPITQQACESMIVYMNKWLNSDKRYQIRNRQIIPRGINCDKLLRELSRELEIAKNRCGSTTSLKFSSMSIVPSSLKVVLPIETKQELVELSHPKIKVKCRRISSTNVQPEKIKQDLSNSGMKLTIKTSLSGCRKPTDDRSISPIIAKKKIPKIKQSNLDEKTSITESTPKTTYTLDLEAKRQRFIGTSNHQSDTGDNQSSSDTNVSSTLIETLIDPIDSQDDNQESISGLASFVKSSSTHHDLYNVNKETKIKRERSSSTPKLLSSKKSKTSTTIDGTKLQKTTKKIKNDNSTNSPPKSTNTTSSLSSSGVLAVKKRLSTSPKKLTSKHPLGKILKLANSIKSRGGILS